MLTCLKLLLITYVFVFCRFQAHRKLVFMFLILIMSGSYCCLWFLPMPDPQEANDKLVETIHRLNDTVYLKQYTNVTMLEKYKCHWNCSMVGNFDVYLSNASYINTVYIDNQVSNASCSVLSMDFNDIVAGDVVCAPKDGCNLICFENDYDNIYKKSAEVLNDTGNYAGNFNKTSVSSSESTVETRDSFYMTATFWAFVVLMCVGTVAFNVANCIGDAVCFDVLGELNNIIHLFI